MERDRCDPGKQQAADQGGHGIDGQNRQGVAGANGFKLGGTELAHVDQGQGDDAQDGGDKCIDKVHQCSQPCASLGSLFIPGGIET